MKQYTLLLFYLLFSLGALTLNCDRVKRRVVFNKNSKFFIRLNGKTSVLNSTGIFAHGWAIRINYELPDSIPKMNKIFRRSAPEAENEFSSLATSCVSKHICQLFEHSQADSSCGFFCEIRNIIHSSKGPKADYLKSFLGDCLSYSQQCLKFS
ncbi:uncharacterized protein LOC123316893 [Coccinella septempunctata]|uniref:uncharacterized protein LOC123316893 n=1 Tax=Coccinella septempunctata TaxID=41139 RepID=UPI001D091BE0|nr:uncharacterized protein LOC123316893 [Coccinella septempunctata]